MNSNARGDDRYAVVAGLPQHLTTADRELFGWLIDHRRLFPSRAQICDAFEIQQPIHEMGRLIRIARVENGASAHRRIMAKSSKPICDGPSSPMLTPA